MKPGRYLLCLILVLGLSSCGGLQAVDDPQQQWQKLALTDYDYEVQRGCFCTTDYIRAMQVSVRDGGVQSAIYLDDSTAVSSKVLKSLRTVDEWFAYIEKGRTKPFYRLEVTYHPRQGYPAHIQADVRERVADDEQTVTIGKLLPK